MSTDVHREYCAADSAHAAHDISARDFDVLERDALSFDVTVAAASPSPSTTPTPSTTAPKSMLDAWESVLHTERLRVYRQRWGESGLYRYSAAGEFVDVDARAVVRAFTDPERRRWDAWMAHFAPLGTTPLGSTLIHWVTAMPFPFAARSYFVLRRHAPPSPHDADGAHMVIQRSLAPRFADDVQHHSSQHQQHAASQVRVDTLHSRLYVRDVVEQAQQQQQQQQQQQSSSSSSSSSSSRCQFVFFYEDDVGMTYLPTWLVNSVMLNAIPSFVQQVAATALRFMPTGGDGPSS